MLHKYFCLIGFSPLLNKVQFQNVQVCKLDFKTKNLIKNHP